MTNASILSSIAMMFFVAGHSTLLHYKSKENPILTMKEVILPWPSKGKFPSISCIFLSITFLLGDFLLPSTVSSSSPVSTMKIVFVFGLFPLLMYLMYIKKRINRDSRGLFYSSENDVYTDWIASLAISAIISMLSWIVF